MNESYKPIFEQIVNKIEAANRETKLEVLKITKEGMDIAFQGIKENQDRISRLCSSIVSIYEFVDELQLAVKKIMEKI